MSPIPLHASELANLATGNPVHQAVEANVESDAKYKCSHNFTTEKSVEIDLPIYKQRENEYKAKDSICRILIWAEVFEEERDACRNPKWLNNLEVSVKGC